MKCYFRNVGNFKYSIRFIRLRFDDSIIDDSTFTIYYIKIYIPLKLWFKNVEIKRTGT